MKEHQAHRDGVDAKPEEDAQRAKPVGGGFEIAIGDDVGKGFCKIFFNTPRENPFHSQHSAENVETGKENDRERDDDECLGMDAGAGDESAGKSGGGDRNSGKADYHLGALMEDIELSLKKPEKKGLLAGECRGEIPCLLHS